MLDNAIQLFVQAFDKPLDALQRKPSTIGPGECASR